MPRCQRTLRSLPGDGRGAAWTCPFCPDEERYRLIGSDAPDLLDYAQFGWNAALRDFGRPADARLPFRLIRGLSPECVRTSRGYDLYLGGNSDALQTRLQIGHELFHRVCSQGQVFHWTHEMMACVFSVRLLRAAGYGDYADQMDRAYRAQAEALPFADLLMADVAAPPYPAGLYGRAYVTGDALTGAVGWASLTGLVAVQSGGHARVPDVSAWFSALAADCAQRASEIIHSAGV